MAAAGALSTLPLPSLAGGTPLYVTGEDAIRLTAFNAAAGVTLSLSGRFLPLKTADAEADPRVGPFVHTLVPATDRTASLRTAVLGEGWLLDWSVVASAGSPLIGQCYAVVTIVRGTAGNVLELSTLAQGYITANKRLGWPGGMQMDFLDGGGALRAFAGTQPGAGAEVSESVPTGARWMLLAAELDLVTAVAVANRVPQLTLDDGANVYARVSVNQNEVASTTWRNSFQRGVPQTFDGTRFIVTSPIGGDLTMGAGHRIRTVTSGIQAADQYGVPRILVREWIEGA